MKRVQWTAIVVVEAAHNHEEFACDRLRYMNMSEISMRKILERCAESTDMYQEVPLVASKPQSVRKTNSGLGEVEALTSPDVTCLLEGMDGSEATLFEEDAACKQHGNGVFHWW